MQTKKEIKRGGHFLLYLLKGAQSIAGGFYAMGTLYFGLYVVGFTFTLGLPILMITFVGIAAFGGIFFLLKIWDEITRRQNLTTVLMSQVKLVDKYLAALEDAEPSYRLALIEQTVNALSEGMSVKNGSQKAVAASISTKLTTYITTSDAGKKERIKNDIKKQIYQGNTNSKNKLFTNIPDKLTQTRLMQARGAVNRADSMINAGLESFRVFNVLKGVLSAVIIKAGQIIKSPHTKIAVAGAGMVGSLFLGGPIAIGIAVVVGTLLVSSAIITDKIEKKVQNKIESVSVENLILREKIERLNGAQDAKASEKIQSIEHEAAMNTLREENRLLKEQLAEARSLNQSSTPQGDLINEVPEIIDEEVKKIDQKEPEADNAKIAAWQKQKQPIDRPHRHRRRFSTSDFFANSCQQFTMNTSKKELNYLDLSEALSIKDTHFT